MSRYVLYNDDVEAASFDVVHSVVTRFEPLKPRLLPMQLRRASAEGFAAWLRDRAIDLSNLQHRNLMQALVGSRDKLTLALRTHVIFANLASLGPAFERDWRRILISDALFFNTDRHMRNFGVIRSSRTGEILRLAPNFDNNQAYLANPGGAYSDAMLNAFMASADGEDRENLRTLCHALEGNRHLVKALEAGEAHLR